MNCIKPKPATITITTKTISQVKKECKRIFLTQKGDHLYSTEFFGPICLWIKLNCIFSCFNAIRERKLGKKIQLAKCIFVPMSNFIMFVRYQSYSTINIGESNPKRMQF